MMMLQSGGFSGEVIQGLREALLETIEPLKKE